MVGTAHPTRLRGLDSGPLRDLGHPILPIPFIAPRRVLNKRQAEGHWTAGRNYMHVAAVLLHW
jgi:hypothetical protein